MPVTYAYGYDTLYLFLLVPVLLFSLIAQLAVKGTFSKYNKVRNQRGITGCEAARRVLDANGLRNVRIERVSGSLTDHYDPKNNVIRLSDDVYGTASIAAVGVAAHEAGHAVQYAADYTPIRIRSAIVGVTQFASRWAVWICFIGVLLSFGILAEVGFWLFAVVAFFQFVTLPVEFNASHRALETLGTAGVLDNDELRGAKKVLTAAAMTYVAALCSSLVQLVRLYLMINGNSRRKR